MAMRVAQVHAKQSAELSEEELGVVLAITGLHPNGQSPLLTQNGAYLQPATPPYNAGIVSSLQSKGIVDSDTSNTVSKEWGQALETLAGPLWDISLILGKNGQMKYDRYFCNSALASENLVFYRSGQGSNGGQIAFPFSAEYVMRLLHETVSFNSPAVPLDVNIDLTYKEYIVLVAALDLLRKRLLETLLECRDNPSPLLTTDEIKKGLEDGLKRGDIRWLVPLTNTVSPFEFDLSDVDIESIVEELQRKELLCAPLTASDTLLSIAASLLVVPAFCAFELTFIKAPQVYEINYFCAVRGSEGLWLFDFYDLATTFPRVSLSPVSGEELSLMLERLVEDSREKTQSVQQTNQRQVASRSEIEPRRLPGPPTLRSLKVPASVEPAESSEPVNSASVLPRTESPPTLLPKSMTAPVQQPPAPVQQPPAPVQQPPVPVQQPPEDAQVLPVEKVEQAPKDAHILPPAKAADVPNERPCPHCGLAVVMGKKFCRHCGKSIQYEDSTPPILSILVGGAAENVQTSPQKASAEKAPPEKPRSKPPAEVPTPVAAVPQPQSSTCQVCGQSLAESARFCGHCGAIRQDQAPRSEKTCPSCQGKLAATAKFCALCGYRV